jgi:iron complex outermembrane receptor protein
MSGVSRRHFTVLQDNRSTRHVGWMVALVSCASGVGLEDALAADGAKESQRGSLEEIVVTAQRREQPLEDVPISISVLNGDILDAATVGVTESLRGVPGVSTTISSQGGGTLLNIRGVSAAAGSSPIGYYLDSAPFTLVRSAVAPDPNAYDLDRIEVLRGPQGTLYGASAQNGVVRVLTRDADPEKFEFKMRAGASSIEDGGENYRGDMAINVPIVDGKVAVRAVAGYEELGGWIDRPGRKDANDGNSGNWRLKVNAQPTDKLSVGFSAWLSRVDYDSRSSGTEDRTSPSLVEEPFSTDYDLYGLKIAYDFSTFSVSSVTSHLEYTNVSITDYAVVFPTLPNTLLVTGWNSKVLSQEINFESTQAGPWHWAFGGIYRDGEDELFQWRKQYLNPGGNRSVDATESYAVFGEVTRSFADGRFELTAGLRYFEDEQVMQELSRAAELLPPPGGYFRETSEFDALSPRAVLAWHPTQELMTYVSYSEGFRSGFAQHSAVLFVAPEFPSVDSDNLVNYEWGAKGSLWGGRLNFDVAAFYIDWSDIQQPLMVQGITGTGAPATLVAPINGESASGVGAEFALKVSPFSGLELTVACGWNDLTMDADVISATGVLVFREGDRLAQSPEQTVSVSADYAFALGAGGYEARIAASAAYTSELERRALVDGVSHVLASDSLLVSRLSFAVDSPSHWTTTLFVDNLNDEKGSTFTETNPALHLRMRPRTAGVQLEYQF